MGRKDHQLSATIFHTYAIVDPEPLIGSKFCEALVSISHMIRFSYADPREILAHVRDDVLDLTPLLGVFCGVLVFQFLQI